MSRTRVHSGKGWVPSPQSHPPPPDPTVRRPYFPTSLIREETLPRGKVQMSPVPTTLCVSSPLSHDPSPTTQDLSRLTSVFRPEFRGHRSTHRNSQRGEGPEVEGVDILLPKPEKSLGKDRFRHQGPLRFTTVPLTRGTLQPPPWCTVFYPSRPSIVDPSLTTSRTGVRSQPLRR